MADQVGQDYRLRATLCQKPFLAALVTRVSVRSIIGGGEVKMLKWVSGG